MLHEDHVIGVEVLPPSSSRERSAQTLTVQALNELQGGASKALLALAPQLSAIDSRVAPASTTGAKRATLPPLGGTGEGGHTYASASRVIDRAKDIAKDSLSTLRAHVSSRIDGSVLAPFVAGSLCLLGLVAWWCKRQRVLTQLANLRRKRYEQQLAMAEVAGLLYDPEDPYYAAQHAMANANGQ